MRWCRLLQGDRPTAAIYSEQHLIPLAAAAAAYRDATGTAVKVADDDDLLAVLPPDGRSAAAAAEIAAWVQQQSAESLAALAIPTGQARLLVPIARPNKLFLLAGNYAAHIAEGGGVAAERAETFPYVFMKPPTTTLTHPGDAVRIPKISPGAIDWELELAVVIGRGGKGISQSDALQHVAGYTVINDISDRKFHPNAERKPRPKDGFFDWLHGKWHDSSCPCGPCIASADALADPQGLAMRLSVNGRVHQDASTAQQIFPVAAVIAFISSFVTLEPGDIISTGTPAGVGNTSGTYLKPGDRIEATIASIGTLTTPVEAED